MTHVRTRFWLAFALAAAAAQTTQACSVPVFRYALERWAAAEYDVYVFHRGPLSAEDAAAVEMLRPPVGAGRPAPPLALHLADVTGTLDDDAAAIWRAQQQPKTPWMVVRFPKEFSVPQQAWSGPLTAEAAERLLDSPARRRIARLLLEGSSAVFVLLDCADRAKNDAAAALLDAELKRLQQVLRLPEPVQGRWNDPVYDSQGAPQLRLEFPVVRIPWGDHREELFATLLLGGLMKPADLADPVAMPIFGRGRLLCTLLGRDIVRENLEDVCSFLVGPCSCIVKEENPGVDMLMTVDWDAALAGQPSAIPPVEPPPLAGLGDFIPDRWRGRLLSNVVLAAGAGLVVTTIVAIVMWRRGKTAKG